MASSKEHYASVLSPVYSWMCGGSSVALERNSAFFANQGLSPKASGIAVDLGAGCGFQSIPLARLGYKVTAIDLDRSLLEELREYADGLPIDAIEDDLLLFRSHVHDDIELIVCMTDTLLHLESKDDVLRLFVDVHSALARGGKLVITFRDLTYDVRDLDRFIPVRNDADTIFTCFVEYESETVKVHDLVYRRAGEYWEFSKSYYRKLRLSPQWVTDKLQAAGFTDVQSESENGLVTLIAENRE